jgi:signal transduction histidine kinase
MVLSLLDKISYHWEKVREDVEIADVAFIVLRIIIFAGGLGWLIFTDLPIQTFEYVSAIFAYFAVYSLLIFLWLFISPAKKRRIYGVSLVFDLLYITLLVRVTGGFQSSFFNGFYLITALYAFYYGLIPGTAVAAVSGLMYFISCGYDIYKLQWTDFFVRIAFLFLLAVPLGLLSEKLKKDKRKMEQLNRELEDSIEELRRMQKRLIQTEKLSALGRLTADVAHEIRNPLTSIGGFARRLYKKLSPGSREKGYAEVVVSEVDRLERILRDVLTFSREARYEMQTMEINAIVEESLQTYAEVCADQNIEIEKDLYPELPAVLVDPGQIRLAIDNIISNAIDVMSDGGRLKVKTLVQELFSVEYVTIEVSDTGPGLHDEALDRIFEPFYTTKEIGVGTGLGLSICKNIVDEHNGLIFAGNRETGGTTFSILLPYQSRDNGARIPCWEFHKCGVEKAEGAVNMRCPAYPHYGRICWAIAGTFCGKKVSGAIAQKLGDCRKCEFYRRVALKKDL